MEADTPASVVVHPAATDHLPIFITVPGETDVLFNAMVVFLILVVLLAGNFYLRLHALPEQLAHGSHKIQLQVVAVLALIALFTHSHIYWIAALLLALVPVPDFAAPINSIAASLEKLSRRRRTAPEVQPQPPA
jgi:hypothetical protein